MHVIATAGHVDHGKSTLVRALTGMEPDRWAEERRRGMTIDLGFAWMTLPGGEPLAFVDVPGHERFVPNMLAGVGPVPAVLFTVAADGGWMPQSAEHLAAIDALGVRHGVLAVTRADLADPGPVLRRASAELGATSLGRVEAVAVSAMTGAGLDSLRDALARLAAGLPAPSPDAAVRLWVDRSFTIRGAGTVVTGTLPGGTLRTGQELLLTPSMLPVRVRGIESLREPAATVRGVARVALNLRGVPPDVPERGMALIEAGRWTLTGETDVRLEMTAGRPAAVGGVAGGGVSQPRLPRELALHIGSARTPVRVRVLGAVLARGDDPPEPPDGPLRFSPYHRAAGGPWALADRAIAGPVFARLTLRDPLPLHVGDRVLLRDPGADRSASQLDDSAPAIIGATVLDVAPPPLGRRGAAATAARELAGWPAVPAAADLIRRHGLLTAGRLGAMGLADLPAPVAGDWLADPARWARLRKELIKAVAGFTAREPLAPGMPVETARSALGLPSRDLVAALARGPGDGGRLVNDKGYLRLAPVPEPGQPTGGNAGPGNTGSGNAGPGSAASGSTASGDTGPRDARGRDPGPPLSSLPPLPPRIAEAIQAVRADLAKTPFRAPEAGRLRELGLDVKAVAAAARNGLLLRVSDQIVLAPGADAEAARVLGGLPQPFTTAEARQALDTTRRVVIPLLEYLDRARVTERLPDDRRRLRAPVL